MFYYFIPDHCQILLFLLSVVDWGRARSRDTAGTANHKMINILIKAEEGGNRVTFRFIAFVFPRNSCMCGALLCCKWQNTCLPRGSAESIPYFALHSCTAWLYLLNCPYLNSQVFSPLCFLPHPTLGKSVSVGLNCIPGLTHNKQIQSA